jgi:hypothetical protein
MATRLPKGRPCKLKLFSPGNKKEVVRKIEKNKNKTNNAIVSPAPDTTTRALTALENPKSLKRLIVSQIRLGSDEMLLIAFFSQNGGIVSGSVNV